MDFQITVDRLNVFDGRKHVGGCFGDVEVAEACVDVGSNVCVDFLSW